MSSDRPTEPNPSSLAGLSLSIFQDLLSNLTHDLVLQAHRTEKLLRTQQQQQNARLATTSANGSSGSAEDVTASQIPVGNPLATVPAEILCPRCNLPRHTPETLSQGTILLESGEKKKFCSKPPFQNMRGHDIYGNPFPNPNGTSGTKKSKKEAMAAAAAAAAQDASSNGDSPSAGTPAPNGDAAEVPTKVGKSSGIVYFKCTNCDQEKVAASRYAAHLEKCLGLAGRKSSRAAMAKMSGTASGTGSPMLLPADSGTGKSGSRKPSPEKNGRATPVPGDDVSVKSSFSAAPSLSSSAIPSTSTPKKKKKIATAPSTGDTVSNPSPQMSKSSAPVVPILPAGPTSAMSTTSAPSSTGKDTSAPPKKRKRKPEGGEDGEAASTARPKKPKLAAAPSSGNASIASTLPSYSGSLSPDTPKKSTLIKIKAKASSPTPSDPSLSPTITKKKIAKKPPTSVPDGSAPIKKAKKPAIGRPPKLAQAPPTSSNVSPRMGMAGKSVPGKTAPGTIARKGTVGVPAGSGNIQ